jgi:hypothetical protein
VSEPESFVSRWARLKRETAQAPEQNQSLPDAAPEQTPAPQAVAPGAESAEPAVDLSALPPLESITGATDIRGYLAPGVPSDLTRAALRRAWVADPTIRDFIGIAENQWDFNDPNGVPGFGPLDEAGRALARKLFGVEQAAAPANAEMPSESAAKEPQDEKSPESVPPTDATLGEVALGEDHPQVAAAHVQPLPYVRETAVALQQKEEGIPPAPAIRRGHGGALPK